MPAPSRYEPPHTQLRRLASEARTLGLSFEVFWDQAVRPGKPLITRHRRQPPSGCIVWPRDTFDRQNDIAAISETREIWRRAYENAPPSRGELALQALGPALDGLAAVGDVRSPGEPEHAVAA